MSLRHAVMAALLEGKASGYDLAKAFDKSVGNFWPATPQQLYRELDRMLADGLIQARLVEQERRPNKRLFSLTEAGRAELRDFTATPPRPGAVREDLMVMVQAVDVGDAEAVRAAIEERMAQAQTKIETYERRRARMLDGRSEPEFFTEAERVGPYLSLARGLAFERENVQWCRLALTALRARRVKTWRAYGAAALQDSERPRSLKS